MDTLITGAEILLKSLSNHGVSTIFGYPGSCVMPILDCLYKEKRIDHILVRHEKGAMSAAQGYAQVSKKVGVVLVTSGPGATNTVTGIADAIANSVPLVVITGQVNSPLLGTDAFQEVDIIGITHSIAKWVCQVRSANEISSVIAHAFYIASTGRPGSVLIDITKDAQVERAIYSPQKVNFIRSYTPKFYKEEIATLDSATNMKEDIADRVISILQDLKHELILVLDIEHHCVLKSNHIEVIEPSMSGSIGFGLPTAIGAKYAAPDKTVCLVIGCTQFQTTIQELGVIMQSEIDIKIILLNSISKTEDSILYPDFVQFANAYNIQSKRVPENVSIKDNIEDMFNMKGACLLEIDLRGSYSKIPSTLP